MSSKESPEASQFSVSEEENLWQLTISTAPGLLVHLCPNAIQWAYEGMAAYGSVFCILSWSNEVKVETKLAILLGETRSKLQRTMAVGTSVYQLVPGVLWHCVVIRSLKVNFLKQLDDL